MITDADIKKLKAVFATKDDLMSIKNDISSMENSFNQKFATKNDLVSMEKRLRKDIVDDMTYYLQEHVIPILNEHEKRLDRLEKHVGGFPAIA